MKNKIAKVVIGFFVALFAVGSFLSTGFAFQEPNTSPAPCATGDTACEAKQKVAFAPCTAQDASIDCVLDNQAKLGASGGFVVMALQTIANFLQFLFLWVINALGDFINFFSEQAYTVPPWLFEIWSTLTKVGLGAIVLAVSVSAFLIAAHLNGEASARVVVANTVKVVVLMALSWTLTWAAITQAQILENVIYDIAPAARDIRNFATVIKITNVTKLRPAGDGIIAKDSGAMTYNDITILARTVISDVIIFLMIVPMAIVLAAWLVRTVIIYIALPLSGIAMLGLFHPSWKSKLFDEWLTRFLTVLKMPLVLAAYFVLAMIIFQNVTKELADSAVKASDWTTAMLGIFGKTKEEVFQNLIGFVVAVAVMIKGATDASSNDMTAQAVELGKKGGKLLQSGTLRTASAAWGATYAAGTGGTKLAWSGVKRITPQAWQDKTNQAWEKTKETKDWTVNKMSKQARFNSILSHEEDLKKYYSMTDAQRQNDAGQKLHEKLTRNANVLGLDHGHIAAGLVDKNHTAATEAEREKLKAKLAEPPSAGRKVWDLTSNVVTTGIKGATSDYGTWAKGTQKVYEKIAEGIKGDQEMEALRKARSISSVLTVGSKFTGGEWREAAGIAPGMPGSFSTKIKSQVTDEVYKKIKTETEGFSTQELFNYYKKYPKDTTDEYAQELKYQTLLKLVEKAKYMDKNQAQQVKEIFNGAKTKEDQIAQWNKPVALQEYAGKMRGENHWFGDADITADDFYGFTGRYDNSKATLNSLTAAKGFLSELTIDKVKLKEDGKPAQFSETLTRTLYDPDALSKTGKDVEDSFVNGFRGIKDDFKNMHGVREKETEGKEKEIKPTESAKAKQQAILDQIGEIKDLQMENPDLNQP